MTRATLVLALALGLLTAPAVRAQVPGGGVLAGGAVLRVKGCGRGRAVVTLIAGVLDDGTWTAIDAANVVYAGTYTRVGSGGRRFDLGFDAASESTLVAALAAAAGELCRTPVAVASAVRKKFLLRLNRKGTVAKITLVYAFTGSAGGRQGTARYVLKAKGPWGPL